MNLRAGAAVVVCALCGALPACKEESRQQLYFRDLTPPVGAGKVNIVSDTNLNIETGGEITVLTAVEPDVDRDELDRLMLSFYRQVKDRRGFKKGDKPSKIDLRFYTSEAAAKKGGEDWMAQVLATGEGEPTNTNRQKVPLLKWVKKALGKQPEYTGKLQPQILADPVALSVELTIPYVADDGTGAYVETLSYVKAITEFVAYTRTLFDKIEPLRKLTFIGKHNDAVALKIWLTRQQYHELDLQQVEESLGAFQGQFIEPIMSKQISEKSVEAKVKAQRRKVYKETLARLPKEQVEVSSDLKDLASKK
jgi:hypothetical protein